MGRTENENAQGRGQGPGSTNAARRRSKGPSIFLILLALVAIGYLLRDEEKRLSYPKGIDVKILIPAGAPPEFKRLHAFLLRTGGKDMSNPSWRNPLLSLAHFKPDGATFPEGIEVVFPLGESRPAGSILWIVNSEDKGESWRGTGESAKVGPDGVTAAGRVYHFSYIGLVEKPLGKLEEAYVGRPAQLHIPEAKISDFQKMLNQSIETADRVLKRKPPEPSPQIEGTRLVPQVPGPARPPPETSGAPSGGPPAPPDDLGEL
jgi:hypothetical protein